MTAPAPRRLAFLAMAVCALAARLDAVVVNGDWTLTESATLAGAPIYDGVGWVEIREGTSTYRGTGVLIAPDWVLTAAHNWIAGAVTGLGFIVDGERHDAVAGQWVQHPGWVADPSVGLDQGWDIALFRLVDPVAGIVPATLYSGSAELGAEIVFLGAGMAGTGATGPQSNPAAAIYAGRNAIDRALALPSANGEGGLLAVDFDDGTGSRNSLLGSVLYDTLGHAAGAPSGAVLQAQSSAQAYLELEATSAAGDSGGPAFTDFGAGLELVGLVSWGVNPTNLSNPYGSGYGDVTYLTRVSAFGDWIGSVIPEPDARWLLLAGIVLVLLMRRCAGRGARA